MDDTLTHTHTHSRGQNAQYQGTFVGVAVAIAAVAMVPILNQYIESIYRINTELVFGNRATYTPTTKRLISNYHCINRK